mmetsp:Transcript_16428/g.49220  ORF Transcript_16428/g.49220 Transcript_16428/m.49220 type:complete len:107 (+) Transcript_16428:1856-2176(+)
MSGSKLSSVPPFADCSAVCWVWFLDDSSAQTVKIRSWSWSHLCTDSLQSPQSSRAGIYVGSNLLAKVSEATAAPRQAITFTPITIRFHPSCRHTEWAYVIKFAWVV